MKRYKNMNSVISIISVVLPMTLTICFFTSLWGLAVDEKLPLRILKVSDTKKTLLINRGIEDGLVVGDHARFFLTTGVVARGIVVKTSPSRSIWSLYRVINPEEINEDQVMNLKITIPVKLTNDPTKMFSDQNIPKPPTEGITLAEGGNDFQKNLSDEERQELIRLQSTLNKGAYYPHVGDTSLELWSMVHFNSMTSKNSLGADQEGSTGHERFYSVLFGLEKYFENQNAWYTQLSLSPFLHYESQSSTNLEGHTLSSDVFEYGGKISWHFLNSPLYIGGMILMVEATAGLGASKDNATYRHNVKLNASDNYTGACSFFSAGGGFKYYFGRGFGVRGLVDYYRRSEKYAIENSQDNYTKLVMGPRMLLGLSYRW